MNPLISVIVPVYNVEDHISNTIKSILEQTYDNIEIICVNDGSTDSSGRIVEELSQQHERIKLINKSNAGVTHARLDGVRAAEGEYIGFVDGDDIIDSDMYEHLMKNALEYKADISHCGYRTVNGNSVEYHYNTGESFFRDRKQGLLDLLEGTKIEPSLCNKLYRASLFRRLLHTDLMDCGLKNNEDLLMNYYLFVKAGTSVYEDFCPYQYMYREGSASVGEMNENRLLDPVRAAKIIYADCSDSPVYKTLAASILIKKLVRAATYFGGSDEVKKARKRAQKELKSFLSSSKYLAIDKKLVHDAKSAAKHPRMYSIKHKEKKA